MRAFRKKELRLLRPPEPGVGSARYSATHRCKDYSSFTALAHTVRIGVAILLSGVRPPQRLHSKSAKRYQVQTSHTHSLTLDYSVRFVEIIEKISSHQYRIINYYQSNNNAKRREEPIGYQTKQSLCHLISFFGLLTRTVSVLPTSSSRAFSLTPSAVLPPARFLQKLKSI